MNCISIIANYNSAPMLIFFLNGGIRQSAENHVVLECKRPSFRVTVEILEQVVPGVFTAFRLELKGRPITYWFLGHL